MAAALTHRPKKGDRPTRPIPILHNAFERVCAKILKNSYKIAMI
jgi:hypothetical protein